MPAVNRSGIKRVEVVVVATMLFVGMSLLVVYALHQREMARRQMCLFRQTHLVELILSYEAASSDFPGYVNRLESTAGGETVKASWVVMLLPDLSQEDLWKSWQSGDRRAIYMPKLVCPADFPTPEVRDSGPLSFVVNCGVADDSGKVNYGVFREFDGVSLDYINRSKGTATVLLLSENIQAGYWTDTTIPDVGMVAFQTPGPCSGINQCIYAGDRPQEIKYARPSSFHNGGVNAAFCDGNGRFINQDIDYSVYRSFWDLADQDMLLD